MADKSGTLQQQRNACFPTTTAKATGGCPLTGPDVAIVPMRYALDRSRYDADPKKLKPLLKSGKWAALPALKTRSYTLRQLRNGYVYVFDETEKTLHEYEYDASGAMLTRIKWDSELIGRDVRQGSGPAKTHLLYPRKNTIRIAYSTLQWTWRICEYMRSNGGSRKAWMQTLDLKEYCLTMKSAHTLPLTQLAEVVADIDRGSISKDGRFADSANPPESNYYSKEHIIPVAADVVWIGSVADSANALIFALDDSLAMLTELNAQLIADQANYIEWQNTYQHKLNIAEIVDDLCGAGAFKNNLPPSVINNKKKKDNYISDVESYYQQLHLEDTISNGTDTIIMPSVPPSTSMAAELKKKYGALPPPEVLKSWEARSKWRRQVDLNGAREYISANAAQGATLLENVKNTQKDLIAVAQHIGAEPLALLIDTTNPSALLYLQAITAEILKTLAQDHLVTEWLTDQDLKASTLLGLCRFGFSLEIQSALTNTANKLIQGTGDITTIISRVGELNGFITHDKIAEKAWMKALSEPAKLTVEAMQRLAKSTGKVVFEQTLLALLPIDSRLARSKQQNLPALLRNLFVGHLLIDHKDRLEFDKSGNNKFTEWKRRYILSELNLEKNLKQWHIPLKSYDRRALGRNILKLQNDVQTSIHELPSLLDYQNNKYAKILGDEIRSTIKNGGLAASQWQSRAKSWSAKYGIDAGPITWGVAIINIFNTAVIYNTATTDGDLNEKDVAKIRSSAGYTANALMAIFIETKWASMKGLEVVIDAKNIRITEASAKFWENVTSPRKTWGNIIRGFGARLIALGSFSLVATGYEYWDIQDDLKGTSNKDERTALIVKRTAVIAMSAIGLLQVITGIAGLAGSSSMIALAMNPWVAGAALIAGIVYLVATAALNYFKRDAIGQWLHKSTWSNSPSERINDQNEENRSLLEIQMSPSIFVKPTFCITYSYSAHLGQYSSDKQDGAWIQIHFPAELRGHIVRTNLAASHRPFYMLPVKRLDDQLQLPFLDNGVSVQSTSIGNVPKIRPELNPTLSGIPPVPGKGESLVWQTWVPLTADAQNIEFQIWYPSEILSSGKGDRGYRYQLELADDGVNDQKDTRISSLDDSTLVVQELGGRENAAVLPILE